MSREEKALHDVRRKISETLNKMDSKITVGYRGEPEPKREEGEVWTDREGKQWTVKNGIKQSISKLQNARTPWWCPVCEKPLNRPIDVKFWRIRGKCHDCVVEEETAIRLRGEWRDYEDKKIIENQIAWLKERIVELVYYVETLSDPEIVHSDGEKILMVEKWSVDVDKIKKDMMEEVIHMNKLLKDLETEYEERFGGEEEEESDEH